MSVEIKELMEKIEPAREKVFLVSTKCIEFITSYPSQQQKLVDLWSKAIENSSQKLSLLFLCNDILRNSISENLRSLFQFSLSRAISLACTDYNSVGDIRKLIKMWGDCQLFSRAVLEDWDRICVRAEQAGSKSDRSHLLYIISLGTKMRSLKNAAEASLCAGSEEKIKAAFDEQRAREELIKEIVACMKKVYHGHLNITICLKKINQKLSSDED